MKNKVFTNLHDEKINMVYQTFYGTCLEGKYREIDLGLGMIIRIYLNALTNVKHYVKNYIQPDKDGHGFPVTKKLATVEKMKYS